MTDPARLPHCWGFLQLAGTLAARQGSKAEVIIWMERGVPALWEEQSSSPGCWGCGGHPGDTDPVSPGEQWGGKGQCGTSQLYPIPLPGDFRATEGGAKARGGMPLPLAPTWHVQCP